METRKQLVKSPILAAMQFGYSKGQTTKNRMTEIGYDLIELIWTMENQLISEKRVKRVFYKP